MQKVQRKPFCCQIIEVGRFFNQLAERGLAEDLKKTFATVGLIQNCQQSGLRFCLETNRAIKHSVPLLLQRAEVFRSTFYGANM